MVRNGLSLVVTPRTTPSGDVIQPELHFRTQQTRNTEVQTSTTKVCTCSVGRKSKAAADNRSSLTSNQPLVHRLLFSGSWVDQEVSSLLSKPSGMLCKTSLASGHCEAFQSPVNQRSVHICIPNLTVFVSSSFVHSKLSKEVQVCASAQNKLSPVHCEALLFCSCMV